MYLNAVMCVHVGWNYVVYRWEIHVIFKSVSICWKSVIGDIWMNDLSAVGFWRISRFPRCVRQCLACWDPHIWWSSCAMLLVLVFMAVYICNLSRFCVFNKYFYLRWAVSIDFRLPCVYISAHLFVLQGDSMPVIWLIDGIISNLSVYWLILLVYSLVSAIFRCPVFNKFN